MNWFIWGLSNYANITGRASRKEYWMFQLSNTMILFGVAFLSVIGSVPGFLSLYQLVMFVPLITAGIRRMHDVNRSGWCLLIPVYNLILTCTAGDKEDNEYGSVPKHTVSGTDSPGFSIAVKSDPSISSEISQIEKLGELKAKGLLTEEEFEAKKKQILAA